MVFDPACQGDKPDMRWSVLTRCLSRYVQREEAEHGDPVV